MAKERNQPIKRKELQWWDVVIISLILFGSAIWTSTVIFLNTPTEILEQGTTFTAMDNWIGICTIVVELGISYLYLRWRNFDFSQWKYKITLPGTLAAVGIYLLLSMAMDVVSIVSVGWAEATAYVGQGGFWSLLAEVDISLILFSLLNGTYEEIFFLGVCTAVPERQRKGVLCYSLLIRFSFHTYQGIAAALGIGFVIGGIYYFLYRKKGENLYPYMLSHAFADIFGAGLLYLL